MILGSGIALGVYVPALSVKKQLERLGHQADFQCLEELYDGKQAVMEETKRSFHKDFKLAKLTYRLPVRSRTAIDPAKKEALLTRLTNENYDGIITFSGFWAELLQELIEAEPSYKDHLYAVHMDAGSSLSWKGSDRSFLQDIWLYRLEEHRVICSLEPVRASLERRRRILVHGGGWGIGEYEDKIRQLNALGYGLDIIVYYPEEGKDADDANEYYLLDPDWKPLNGNGRFPPLLHYENGKWNAFAVNNEEINPVRVLMERDMAILSKPGGGTLSDSLVTGTPLLFAEALASYETDNQILWTELGLGMKFEDFVQSSKQDTALNEMRVRLEETGKDLPVITDMLEGK